MLDTAPHRIEEYDGVVIGRISDYNSNTYEKDGTRTDENGHNDTRFYDNGIVSQEIDSSIRDSSDYQWFTDYGWAATYYDPFFKITSTLYTLEEKPCSIMRALGSETLNFEHLLGIRRKIFPGTN